MKKLFIAMVIVLTVILFTGCKNTNETHTVTVCYNVMPEDTAYLQAITHVQNGDYWTAYHDYAFDNRGCATIGNLPKELKYMFVYATKGRDEQYTFFGRSKSPVSMSVDGKKRSVPPFTPWSDSEGGYGYKIEM